MNISRSLYIFLVYLITTGLGPIHAQRALLSERIPILKSYDADHLLRVALPLGGIGTGTVSLGGRGELRDWEIMNVPGKGYSTVTDGNDAPFFAIYAKPENGAPITKGLMGPLYDSEYQHAEGRSVNHHGLPRFRDASFESTYPFGIVKLSDSQFPVTAKIVGYNPLIPGDSDASGIPLAVFEIEIHNPTGESVAVAIAGSIRNFIGKDGRKYRTDWKGDYIPTGAKGNENTYRSAGEISGIFMQSNELDPLHPAWGTMALTTSAPADQVSYRTSSVRNSWSRGILDFWDDFSADGELTEKKQFEHATRDNGFMSFRVNLPLDSAHLYRKAAADGQMGTIMKFYREWQLSGDDTFLRAHWDKVKLAFTFAWIKGGWDGNQDGVMEGVQHNTMDVEYFGPNPQMQFWYLGALSAVQHMAEYLGEKELARKCATLFQKGSEWTDKNLFNGAYYIHKVQIPESKDDIFKGLMAGMGSKDLQNPQYQLEEGCLIDQLVGQYMAHVLGLGYLAKPENIQTTLKSIKKYNQRETLFEHFNNMRSYAMGDEKALLMVSYPNGGRPEVPFPYWSEVMTGFEYTAAIGMLYEGMETEGLEVIRNIRDRYDGSKRNPFDEAECGHHYARAMASWAGILAQSGFQFSAVEQSMKFRAKAGKWFWSNGSAWGVCTLFKQKENWIADLTVMHGKIDIQHFSLGEEATCFFNETKTITEGESLEIRLNAK